jgi:2-polyprenyl-3-methyl-5-hydroxy-6-metoxy-1,4-benzoquinol methylase
MVSVGWGPGMDEFTYSGDELEVFEHAKNWKKYWSGQISPHIGRRILEVGAGIGSTATTLRDIEFDKWLCIEPDSSLCARIEEKIGSDVLSRKLEVRACLTSDIDAVESFDTILYIDVLEHIEDDKAELSYAADLLERDGRVIVVSPAHNYLYSPFDKKIGHFRRYSKESLIAAIPPGLELIDIRYLDSVGLLASLANKLLLKTSDPTRGQIKIWDSFMVPVSVGVDWLIRYSAGKSVMAIMKKKA